MIITFSLYRYSPRYQYEIMECRNGKFHIFYKIKDVILKKETETKNQYQWLAERYPELLI